MLNPFSSEFEAILAQPVGMLLSVLLAGAMVFVLLRVAMVPERRAGWVDRVTGRNARWVFLLLIVAWTGFMFFVTFLPVSYHGALQFVGLLAGFFIFMGFTWAVIGE
jgi:hypothetical protein